MTPKRLLGTITKNRCNVSSVKLSLSIADKLRKNSNKKSSYASNKIEGNPLTENEIGDKITITKKTLVFIISVFFYL